MNHITYNQIIQKIPADMQTAKPTDQYKFNQYNIEMTVFANNKISLTISDSQLQVQYRQKQVQFTTINAQTLIKAIKGQREQIKLSINPKDEKNQILEIKVTVSLNFLKPIQEILLIKKFREIPCQQIHLKALQFLNKKVKQIKGEKKLDHYYGIQLDEKQYTTGNNYEPIVSAKLPKGKYLLTCSFLLKPRNTWLYIYVGNGAAQFQPHCGFYSPNSTNFMPYTVRIMYSVTQDNELVSITTYYAQSYPVVLKNCILTAKKIE